ncbi:MAG TPA: inositol monophosphatase family protein [Planctomicrobium sp.]|nr:inositol monophosphatase family protein [Planctomicrobium sp.]
MFDFPAVDERLAFALSASRQAEDLVMSFYGDAALSVELKSDQTPVTAADRGAEELLRKRILERFPEDAILGEEFGETSGTSGFRWILDPVDGTKSFVHQVPLFGMLIGLQHQGANVAGICRLPAIREVVYASRGKGAWWQQGDSAPVRAKVSGKTELKDSLFCYTAVDGFQQIGRTDVLETLSRQCGLSRGWGDCYGHMLVATGRADLMIDPLLAEWDACALIPIVEEAGGVFIDWTGVSTANGGNGISMTPGLRSQIQTILANSPEQS